MLFEAIPGTIDVANDTKIPTFNCIYMQNVFLSIDLKNRNNNFCNCFLKDNTKTFLNMYTY